MSEQKLTPEQILRWKAGDPEIDELILALYERLIHKQVWKYVDCRDAELREDLLQECYLVLFGDVRHEYDLLRGRLSTYLTWQLSSRLGDLARQRCRRAKLWYSLCDQDHGDQADTQEPSYEVDYVSTVHRAALALPQLIETLPNDWAVAIKSRYGIGCKVFDQKEIGKLLGKSRETIRKYEQKAVRMLRQKLIDLFGEDTLADIL